MQKTLLLALIAFSFTLAACVSGPVDDNADPATVNSNSANVNESYSIDEQFEQLFAANAGNAPSEIPAVLSINRGPANFKAPARIDWSSYATPVRNQGIYPSCTAFATLAAIEIQENIKSGSVKNIDYSEIDLFYRSKGRSASYWKSGGVVKWCLESAKAFNGYCKEAD
mgnify:FL=1